MDEAWKTHQNATLHTVVKGQGREILKVLVFNLIILSCKYIYRLCYCFDFVQETFVLGCCRNVVECRYGANGRTAEWILAIFPGRLLAKKWSIRSALRPTVSCLSCSISTYDPTALNRALRENNIRTTYREHFEL